MCKIKLDIIHYHLHPGGVTRIIESQIKSICLQSCTYDIRLYTSSCDNKEFYQQLNIKIIEDEIFAYADFNENNPEIIAQNYIEVEKASKKYFEKDRIIHFHNLNLGKNPYWTMRMSLLAEKGYNIINHTHDFAEDRTENISFLRRIIEGHFLKDLYKIMYPDSMNYHYLVLTNNAVSRLIKKGIKKSRIHLCPNPTEVNHKNIKTDKEFVCKTLQLDSEKKIITYPVRVIRRKNIGELILLSVLFSDSINCVVTLAPTNPIEKKYYKDWIQYTEKNNININYEASNKIDFTLLISSSDFCITTSKEEGFGMVYIEPWIMNTPVIGRSLKNITDDLTKNTMILNGFYNEINVISDKKLVDFSSLDEKEQQKLITELLFDDNKKDEIKSLNPLLEKIFEEQNIDIVNHNKKVIKKNYSIISYGKRLKETYKIFTR